MIRQVAALAGLVVLAAVLWLSSLGVQSLTAPAPVPVVITRTLVVTAPAPPPPPTVPTPPAVVEAEPTPASVVVGTSMSMAQVQEPRRYYDAPSLALLLIRTHWPRETWSSVIGLVMCESGGDRLAVGDLDLLPFDGPSHGLTQTNIRAHPVLAVMYDLFDALDNLRAGYEIWVDAGRSFSPWRICAAALGLG